MVSLTPDVSLPSLSIIKQIKISDYNKVNSRQILLYQVTLVSELTRESLEVMNLQNQVSDIWSPTNLKTNI